MSDEPSGWSRHSGLVLAMCVVAVIASLVAWPTSNCRRMSSPDRSIQIVLTMAFKAEGESRARDLDGNGVQDYWTRDWAGFYPMKDASGQSLILIERCTAAMDFMGAASYKDVGGTAAMYGYWVGAMSADEQGRPLQIDADGDGKAWTHPSAFAFCAWPEHYGANYHCGCKQHGEHVEVVRFHYIVNEKGVMYRKDLGHNAPVLRWPATDPTSAGWEVVDELR